MENAIVNVVLHYPWFLLIFIIAGIVGIKYGSSFLQRKARAEVPGEEMKISIVATDNRTGKPIYMKVVHPGKVLRGRFLEHLNKWLAAVKDTCATEGHDFIHTAKIVLPPSVQRTPEFEQLLEFYGLDPQQAVMMGPSDT